MILYLDTTTENVVLKLLDLKNQVVAVKEWQSRFNQSEELLALIDHFLSQNDIKKEDLKAIAANPGPGSYTGLRVGLTCANFLAFSWQIPIISDGEIGLVPQKNQRFQGPLLPIYKNLPVITKKKSRLYFHFLLKYS
jgi:tRNA threonylcarbamoyladenosine biosynthesis protein TsaB